MLVRRTVLADAVVCVLGLLAIPSTVGAETPPPSAVDGPLTPQQALLAFQCDPGLRIELVAAEPLVESPVALAFDERGRLFVAENRGYPTGPDDSGRIALLEDTNCDGTYDTRTEFAGGLSYPNGLMPWRDGLLVTCAPDLLYLQDTDGDGRADRRRVLFTGFATSGSTQLRASHPTLGLDNWIYVTGGLSGGKVSAPDLPERAAVEIGRGDFRFRPDRSQFESADGGAQFGQTFDDYGRRFVCYNRVQIQHVVLPSRYLRRNPYLTFAASVQNCPAEITAEVLRGHGGAARLYPISKNITTADSHAGTFTAACSITVFRGTNLPEKYRGAAFSCDPTGNLVHVDWLKANGATFSAHRSPTQTEFLASPDNWFRPVNLASGPDGALYICDMYRKTIEHPDYLPPEISKYTDFEGGKGMGRIYRVVAAEASRDQLQARRKIALHEAATGELCDTLNHVDGWWRETARRLLCERNDPAATAELRVMVLSPAAPTPAVASALRLLESFEAVDEELLLFALAHSSPEVRENAIQVAESRLATMPRLLDRILALADDPNPRVRYQCALTLGEVSDPRTMEPLARILARDAADRWTRAAAFSSVVGREIDLLRTLAANSVSPTAEHVQLFSELGQLVGAATNPDDQAAAVKAAIALVQSHDFSAQAALLAGLADTFRLRSGGAGSRLQTALAGQNGSTSDEQEFLKGLFATALKIAEDSQQDIGRRQVAIALLGDGDAPAVGEAVLALVDAKQPLDVQLGAVQALRNLREPALAGKLLEADRFSGYTPPVREEVLSSMLSQSPYLPELLAALESEAVPVGMVDSLRRSQLTGHGDAAIRDRAAKVFATSAVGNRSKVYEEYKSVLQLTPDANRGHGVFVKQCSNCHRLDREGVPVGPDLFGIRTQSKETILLHLLIPEYEITPGFATYALETTDGRVLAGLLAAETPRQVTLRQALGKEEIVLRSDIASFVLSKLSLMPQELEKTMTRQEMADLLAFLKGERSDINPKP